MSKKVKKTRSRRWQDMDPEAILRAASAVEHLTAVRIALPAEAEDLREELLDATETLAQNVAEAALANEEVWKLGS